VRPKGWGIRPAFIPLGFASGIIPNPDISGLDSSTIKFQYVSLLELVFHYDHQISVEDDLQVMHFVSGIWVSLKKRYKIEVPTEDYMKLATMKSCIDYLGPKFSVSS
jgi:hypothetical protein